MKCNNKHCKYYRPAEKDYLMMMMGWKNAITEAGCKFPYCKKDKVRRGGSK